MERKVAITYNVLRLGEEAETDAKKDYKCLN
jgi:hypothetical protein